MKILLFLLLSFWQGFFAVPRPELNEGVIVTRDNEVVMGEFSVDLDHNAIFLHKTQGIEVYPSHRIREFRYFDKACNVNRKFVVLPRYRSPGRLQFYEVMLGGKIQVLRINKSIETPQVLDRNPFDEQVNFCDQSLLQEFNYFILNQQELLPLKSFKRKILPGLLQEYPESKVWLQQKEGNPRSWEGILWLVKKYNTLMKPAPAKISEASN